MTSTHWAHACSIICHSTEKSSFSSARALSFVLLLFFVCLFVHFIKVIKNEISQAGLSLRPFSQQSTKMNCVAIPPTTSWTSVHLPYQNKITSALTGATFSDCSPLTVTKIAALISDLGFSFPHSRTVRPPPAIFLQLMSLFIHLFCLLASIFRL